MHIALNFQNLSRDSSLADWLILPCSSAAHVANAAGKEQSNALALTFLNLSKDYSLADWLMLPVILS